MGERGDKVGGGKEFGIRVCAETVQGWDRSGDEKAEQVGL